MFEPSTYTSVTGNRKTHLSWWRLWHFRRSMCGRVNVRKLCTPRIMENLWLCVPRTGRFRCFEKQDVNDSKNPVLLIIIEQNTNFKDGLQTSTSVCVEDVNTDWWILFRDSWRYLSLVRTNWLFDPVAIRSLEAARRLSQCLSPRRLNCTNQAIFCCWKSLIWLFFPPTIDV